MLCYVMLCDIAFFNNVGESMCDDPVVRLAAPGVRIPYGFHADWIPHDKLMAHMMR